MKRIISLILTLILFLFSFPVLSFAKSSAGYVTVSFEDFGIRNGKEKTDFPKQLGVIIPETKVEIYSGDTVADATVRLLKKLNFPYSSTGKTSDGTFYLSSLNNFSNSNYSTVKSFGEFDVGNKSGWMVKLNNWFINEGSSNISVENGDKITWEYTCSLGADIGCDMNNPTSEILSVSEKNGCRISPKFSSGVKSYTLTVPNDVDSISLETELKNYYSTVEYKIGKTSYRFGKNIPVKDGDEITVESKFILGEKVCDKTVITLKVNKINLSKTTYKILVVLIKIFLFGWIWY